MRHNSTYDDLEEYSQENSNPYYKLEGNHHNLGRVIRMNNGTPEQHEQDDEEGISVELDELENDLNLCDPLDLNVELEEEGNSELDLGEGVNVEIESDEHTPQKEPHQNLRLRDQLASEERKLAD